MKVGETTIGHLLSEMAGRLPEQEALVMVTATMLSSRKLEGAAPGEIMDAGHVVSAGP